ncbi:hypothetical protein K435DRAFT_782881 [Dendrothele bispora CBS 962.96]|uniref:Uncharacterized protein n=1 Tax=Dendrothele bispora (strain CBS 962.96) TaxID=1314807 RepID=A0A4S8LCP4_DENBC|nr:hypothetical protein K435DRAFT_782881 [Dendrothele bispora CBS 962.96]
MSSSPSYINVDEAEPQNPNPNPNPHTYTTTSILTNDFSSEFANVPTWNIVLTWLVLFFSFRFFVPIQWRRLYAYILFGLFLSHFSYAKILPTVLSWMSPLLVFIQRIFMRLWSTVIYKPVTYVFSFIWNVILPFRFVFVSAYRVLSWLSGKLLWAFQKLAWFGFYINFFWVGVNFVWYGLTRVAQFLEEVTEYAKSREEEEKYEKEDEERKKRYEREREEREQAMKDEVEEMMREWVEKENKKKAEENKSSPGSTNSKSGKKKKGKH